MLMDLIHLKMCVIDLLRTSISRDALILVHNNGYNKLHGNGAMDISGGMPISAIFYLFFIIYELSLV